MPAEIANVSIDCNDVPKVASFWSAALGRALDNKVPEAKAAKNRVHLDIDELVVLGATVVGNHQISGHGWTVMQDPQGVRQLKDWSSGREHRS
jgi:hypothetical protein